MPKSSSNATIGQYEHDGIGRKRSLVRPERSRIDPDHPQYHYTQVAAQQAGRIQVQAAPSGADPAVYEHPHTRDIPMTDLSRSQSPNEKQEYDADGGDVYVDAKGGRNVYGLNDENGGEDNYEDNPYENGNKSYDDTNPYGVKNDMDHYGPSNLNDNDTDQVEPLNADDGPGSGKGGAREMSRKMSEKKAANKPLPGAKKPTSFWHAYCKIVTFWAPAPVLKLFGMRTKDRQMAWREKMGLITVIMYVAAFVAYLTFGFTTTVCNNNLVRLRNNEVNQGYLIINGRAYEMETFKHPEAVGIPKDTNILYPPVNAAGQDASFLFQNVNGNCRGLITPKADSKIPHDNKGNVAWYFPCQTFSQNGTTQPNFTFPHYNGYACHTSGKARQEYFGLKAAAEVYFTWDDIKNSTRKLVVYNGAVLDLSLLNFIDKSNLNYPSEFTMLQKDSTIMGADITQLMSHGRDGQIAKCLSEVIKVGYIDTENIGCIASQVVLYVSLVFIIGLVGIKFLFACYFKWFISGRQGAFYMDRKQLEKHNQEIEDWSNNIYSQGPIKKAPAPPRRKDRNSKFLKGNDKAINRQSVTMMSQIPVTSTSKLVPGGSIYGMNLGNNDASRNSFLLNNNASSDVVGDNSFLQGDTSYRGAGGLMLEDSYSDYPPNAMPAEQQSQVYSGGPGSYDYLVPQPPVDFQPFGFPLAHTICLVTAYSESIDGLRTTLDSIATTDYPNSHKLILIICDGIIKGSGNDMSTPEIALSMMTDFAEPMDQVKPYSYVSVVSGAKRHNMAKVYSGFYKYDDSTVDVAKQQRVPIMTIVKCGTPAEEGTAKPGNRGKRDSQIILMSFLQRVMFDERMTELEFEIFNGMYKITGIAPDFYEIVLMVDADTKVFPDSITHMVAQMVKDPEVMGLCGETKIANKTESWVSMIQVFEYFISHHQAKAFESVFGGVTCLPGCFCMYRIKAPKGDDGFWIPILANPDIVERYAENVVDTLHKKNLLLLGEDRFLSTLMLRTFPKRKQIFVPKAACKTIVPAEFKVLLSQRRRWINSTVHNLMELVLVRDLCGVFCISMQFVVFVDLVSTLVLPAAITFTLYVVIIAIVRKPTPTMSLILLALILGLPGVLIVITASRLSYVLWMIIYLFSLPIWNFVLPMNAYWKFDDFSWGDTRTIEGGDKGGHDETSGEFDSSQIIMKRWRDFQRERSRNIYPQSSGWGEGTVSMLSSSSLNAPMSLNSHTMDHASPTTSNLGSEFVQRPEDMTQF
ncbi:chitin synthase CHS3 [Sugiyamaella lignohabitans]|uniref:chitin synthase n=1 Tax=Sugiyamaella lignohabitans TaxID=796027 RepID=A0A167ECN1_9ASCO|nr:chitin synthase CHS3 [Sugiyamaella lignohabitans]ANB13910.1 chitin synthase CHS3 [Sugiyamaella lignohabitans]